MEKKLFPLLVLISFYISSYSQKQKGLEVISYLRIIDGTLDNANLTLQDNNTGKTKTVEGVEKILITQNNEEQKSKKFNLTLPFNQSFTLVFNKPNYVTKKLWFDTNAPFERSKQGFYPILLTIVLVPENDSTNIEVFNHPVVKYKYSRELDEFDFTK